MIFETPKNHYEIVNDLLKGKFIIWNEPHFDSLGKEQDFYKKFFKDSFGYELILRKEFAYLLSKVTNEEFSKRFTVLLSVLCYEWNLQGKDIKDYLDYGSFSSFEIQELLKNSNYKDILDFVRIKEEGIEKIIKELDQRNIIKLDNSKENFKFTKAINLFFEFAQDIAAQKIDGKL